MESIKQKVPQIKICGITQDEEIQWLNEADVSYAGFVLYEKSCRYIPISKTQELFEKLNDNIKKVAVVHILIVSNLLLYNFFYLYGSIISF